MAVSWCKVSSSLDSHPKVRKAGNLGRQVFEFALRRNAELDLSGFIPDAHMEPSYLADMLMLSGHDQALSGQVDAVRAGLLVKVEGGYRIDGWDDDWSKVPMSEAERKRRQRANARNSSKQDESVAACPDNPGQMSGQDRDGPDSHALEESRSEAIREEGAQYSGSEDSRPRKPRRAKRASEPLADCPDDWAPKERHLERARGLSLDIAEQATKFKNWHASKGNRFARWDRAFDAWLDNAEGFQKRDGPRWPGNSSPNLPLKPSSIL